MNENIPLSATVASRRRRIAAFMIDHFVMTFLTTLAVFIVLGPDFSDMKHSAGFPVSVMVITLTGIFLYFAKDSFKGISFGKWIMGIMVRDEKSNTEVPSFGRLLIRNLFLILWPVEFIALAASDQKQRLGDRTAKTMVFRNPSEPARGIRIVALIFVMVSFFATTFIFISLSFKNSDAYKVSVKEIEKNKEILAETGGITGFGMLPSGNINIQNGYGQADLGITVHGQKKDLDIKTHLEKERGGEWKLINLENEH